MSQLENWTVYDNPEDFPGQIVVRKFLNDQPTSDVEAFADLESCRRAFELRGLYRIPRSDGDAPVIVETWL
jgi:hypothetical protein